mgnify:FL=1
MASTLLERTRESHEEIERLERAVCADFRHEAVTHKERLAQNHRVRSMLDDAATKAKRLVRASHELPIRNPKHAKDRPRQRTATRTHQLKGPRATRRSSCEIIQKISLDR